jgi:hypothetical protein
MTVKEIYDKYNIPPNLQKHMLRVAALSEILVENWIEGELDERSITFACLFHDMANIIKFDLTKASIFKEEEAQKEYWKKVQLEVMETYGPNIHEATRKIARETGCPSQVVDLITKLEWDNAKRVVEDDDFESGITIYSDMRIGPFGILPLQERIENLRTRNTSHDFDAIAKEAHILESTLQTNISIPLKDIPNSALDERFENLLRLAL